MKTYIFSDINDTIKPENGKISNFTADVLKSLHQKNIELVLVTGKNRQKTEEFAEAYGGSRYIITTNGGEVFDTQTRQVIYTSNIPKNAIEKLYQLSKKHNLRFILNVDADFRFTTRIKYFDGSEKQLNSIDEVAENYKVVGGVLTEIPDDLIAEIKLAICEISGVTIGNEGRNKGNNFIDFISEYANKGIAIKKLLRFLDVDYKNTISIGNERNDISMFSATNKSVAVDNASDEIKKMVDLLIDSVENDGVGKYLKNL